eukprot:3960727-Prymnesium_polylepis.2
MGRAALIRLHAPALTETWMRVEVGRLTAGATHESRSEWRYDAGTCGKAQRRLPIRGEGWRERCGNKGGYRSEERAGGRERRAQEAAGALGVGALRKGVGGSEGCKKARRARSDSSC